MKLSTESWRVRWGVMGGVWLLVALFLAVHTATVTEHLDSVAQRAQRRGAPPTPMSAAYLPGTVDGLIWVRHAKSLLDGGGPQLRHTDMDNAPSGRAVHWNSAWAWTIAGAAKFDQTFTGSTIEQSLERITRWLAPVALLGLIVLMSAYAAKHAGALAGVCIAIAMLGHDYFFTGFIPSYVDHHGLLSASALGLVLGAVFMMPGGSGDARRAANVSAISGAIGMWISAASAIPAIAIVGCAGGAAAFALGRTASTAGTPFDPRVWRTWGRTGAIASLVFYLVEYFPTHLGVRLEANHPFYALAWWGAGELIAEVADRRMRGSRSGTRLTARVALPTLALALAPFVMIVAGTNVFAPLDPFLSHLHRSFIDEFQPLWNGLDGLRLNPYESIVGIENLPLLVGLGVVIKRREHTPPVLWFATFVTLGFTVMAWLQVRWIPNASGPQIVLAMLLAAHFLAMRAPRAQWVGALASFAVLFGPTTVRREVAARSELATGHVERAELVNLLYRDVAAAIRAFHPTGEVTLLTSPNASAWAGFYGQFKTIGTLYWENADGLRTAAEIFSAQTTDEAAQRIREKGITHIAMFSENNFLGPYFQLLHGEGATDGIERTFGYKLLLERQVPTWLRVIPYRPSAGLDSLGIQVYLYQVEFNQTADEWLSYRAAGAMEAGELDSAARMFDTLVAHSPRNYEYWLSRGGLLVRQGEWDRAMDATLRGISLAPAAQQRGLYEWFAGNLIRFQQPRRALTVMRAALASKFEPDMAASLAYMLSTSRDDAMRNGAEAVTLARRALATKPESATYLVCLATALAETGRFDEAVRTAESAATRARTAGDLQTLNMAERVTASFRAKKPWRE
ncbi:MAG TPA: tetratricopeptide repeat protein [Gemmatimonadaceae bacterium]|nr:tetratricopeptide repeat protein [Gemmatimonadaceae bacterium]